MTWRSYSNAWIRSTFRKPLHPTGESFIIDFGIDLERLLSERRPVLRIDLDRTERRDHFAGSLPAALMNQFLDEKWIRRRHDKRQLTVTETGRTGLADTFGIAH